MQLSSAQFSSLCSQPAASNYGLGSFNSVHPYVHPFAAAATAFQFTSVHKKKNLLQDLALNVAAAATRESRKAYEMFATIATTTLATKPAKKERK